MYNTITIKKLILVCIKPINLILIILGASQEYESTSGNNIGVGVGGTGGNVGVGISGGIPIGGRSINRRLILSLVDASKNT